MNNAYLSCDSLFVVFVGTAALHDTVFHALLFVHEQIYYLCCVCCPHSVKHSAKNLQSIPCG